MLIGHKLTRVLLHM